MMRCQPATPNRTQELMCCQPAPVIVTQVRACVAAARGDDDGQQKGGRAQTGACPRDVGGALSPLAHLHVLYGWLIYTYCMRAERHTRVRRDRTVRVDGQNIGLAATHRLLNGLS